MKIETYIKKCKVESVNDLTIEQILEYYEKYNDVLTNKLSVINYRMFIEDRGFPKEIAESVLRESVTKEPNMFICSMIEGESWDTDKHPSSNYKYVFKTVGVKKIVDAN